MGKQNTGTAAVYLDGKPLGGYRRIRVIGTRSRRNRRTGGGSLPDIKQSVGAADRRSGPAGGRFLQMDPQGGGGGGSTAGNGNGAALGVG